MERLRKLLSKVEDQLRQMEKFPDDESFIASRVSDTFSLIWDLDRAIDQVEKEMREE